MTDSQKPLTADEIAERDNERAALLEMIEARDEQIDQQAEQIKKLRAALNYHGAHDGGCPGGSYCTCGYTEALAATEPVNDKR